MVVQHLVYCPTATCSVGQPLKLVALFCWWSTARKSAAAHQSNQLQGCYNCWVVLLWWCLAEQWPYVPALGPTRPSLGQELQQQIWSHTRSPAQQALEVGSLQDLWLPNPAGWSSAVANLLNNALAASTWKRYAGNLRQFKVYCLVNDISFPPEQDEAVGAIASFLESATWSSQQPSSMIASLSPAIGALYKTTDFHPTCDPLLS